MADNFTSSIVNYHYRTFLLQVFYTAHPFEVYRDKMLDQFHFEIENDVQGMVNVQLQFPFGIKGEDNGNHLDPDDRGKLEFVNSFEIFSSRSQEWMLDFCDDLLGDSMTVRPERYRCFFDVSRQVLESARCDYPEFNLTVPDVCCNTTFPVPSTDAMTCYTDYSFIALVGTLANSTNTTLVGAPIYTRTTGELVAMTHVIETDFVWSSNYGVIERYYLRYERFMTRTMTSAPRSVASGWFAGAYGNEFFLYDLQTTMLEGTISGISLSLGVGFAVMLVTSMNIIITIYSMVTIIFIIGVTVGSLVLMGWELGVLEALVITLTVGLSIDFTIHLAVAYKVSPHADRLSRSNDAIKTVGSAVTMAAVTTFLSGAAITLGRVLSYYQ